MAISLLASTGDPRIDQILQGVIELLVASFPDRILGFYLSGSYAAGEAVATSDIDGLVVFKGVLQPEELPRFRSVTRSCSLLSGYLVDLAPRGEADLLRDGELPAKVASRVLFFGEDVCRRVPAMTVEHYTLLVMQGSWFYMALVRGRPTVLRHPLTYPDSDDEFYGYTQNGMHGLNGWDGPGTKALVGGATLAATTLVAIKAGHCAVRSSESILAYRQHLNDEWTPWLEELYDCCKRQWAYQVPVVPQERQRLRELCQTMLMFENHYLRTCREFLWAEIKETDAVRRERASQAREKISFSETF